MDGFWLSLGVCAMSLAALLQLQSWLGRLKRLTDVDPQLEIVAVDDRSTDGTGAILDRMAGSDARLRVIHVRERKVYIGMGAFNMVRASAYRAAGAHESLRMEVVADIHLGKLMKANGFRQDVLHGLGGASAGRGARIDPGRHLVARHALSASGPQGRARADAAAIAPGARSRAAPIPVAFKPRETVWV